MTEKRHVRSVFTSKPGHDFGIKAGEMYELFGWPGNTNSGCVYILEEGQTIPSVWREDYFDISP